MCEPTSCNIFCVLHYVDMPMQYTAEIFKAVKMKIFDRKILILFLFLLQNIHCGYTLEPPRRGGSNEYPQCIFWTKNKKIRFTPAYLSFSI